jgi:long-chain acyl-CoA synthetase
MDMSERLTAAAQVGMAGSVWADIQPDIVEIYDPSGRTRTFGEVNAYANRIARLLRGAGLQIGDAVALLCSNRVSRRRRRRPRTARTWS